MDYPLTEDSQVTSLRKIDGFIEANSLKLSYRQWQGKASTPAFLLIHGLASGLRIWDFVAAQLVQLTGGQAIAFDQRGHGLSDKPDTGYDAAQIVSDDHGLVTALKLEKSILVGHSWGASIALAYAATYPNEVNGLVLVDGGMGNMQDRPDMTWERVEKDLAPPHFAGTPKETYLDYFRKGGNSQYFGPVWNAELEDMLLNIVELRPDGTVGPRLARSNHMQILRSMWETSNTDLAKQVTCPVLMISAETQASEDWGRLKREGAERMRMALTHSPRVEFMTMTDTVHDVPLQRPAVLAETIVKFMQEPSAI